MAILESGELKAQEDRLDLAHQRARRSTAYLARSERYSASRIVSALTAEARLPGVRRAGRVESRQAEAGVPVLRHGVAVHRSTATGKIEELDLAAALREMPDDRARLADRAAHRPVPELQGRDGVRSGAGRAELRVLRLAGARRLRRDQVADPAAEPAAVQGHRNRVRDQIRRWYAQQVVRARPPAARARWSTRSRVSTFRTGPSTRRWSARGKPRPATTTTSTTKAATTRAARRRGRCATCAGKPASGVVEHFFDDEPVPGTQGRVDMSCCSRSSRFRRRNSCPTTPRSSPASSSSTIRWC